MPMPPADAVALLQDVIRKALAAGADAADALVYDSVMLSVTERMATLERIERAESGDLGLRVFVGHRVAMVSSTDRKSEVLAEMAQRAVAMAKAVPEDPFSGLADPDSLTHDHPDLDVCDPEEPTPEHLLAQVKAMEEAARAVPGVTNSEGADASWSRSHLCLAASNGFAGDYTVTRRSLSASVLAGSGTAMESDYDFSSAIYGSDLRAPVDIGRSAGERAVRRLNPRKVGSRKVPVVYDPRMARSLLGHLSSAIGGPAIARGTSFLKDKLGERIFPDGVTITDDPLVRRGLRSRPFDGEGQPVVRRDVVADGVLTTWLLDLRSARKLGLVSTGHASRGTLSPPSPSPSNLFLAPGGKAPDALIGEIKEGFYVTQMMGMGVNGVTGDYSRGASGFWIEDGQLAYPVSEVTVAGNLKDMFLTLEPANDLEFRYGVDAPTVRIDGMTVAGT